MGPTVQIPANPPLVSPPPLGGGPVNQDCMPTIILSAIEVDDQHNIFFSPTDESTYDAFGPLTAEVEKKVCALEEEMKAMEGSNAFELDAADMCLVPSVEVPAKFKVPNFKKYKGVSCHRTHI